MSDARSKGLPEKLGLPRRNRSPVRMWLLFLAVATAFVGGAVLSFDLGVRWARQCAEQEATPPAPAGGVPSPDIVAQERLAGQLLVDQVMYARHWESMEVNERFWPVVRDLVERLKKQEFTSRCISPYATDGPNAPRSDFERRIVARFLKERPSESRPTRFAERRLADPRAYEYYQASYAEKSCLPCHNAQQSVFGKGNDAAAAVAPPMKDGDLIAIVHVVISDLPRAGAPLAED